VAKQHDLEQGANVQAGGRGVEAKVGDDRGTRIQLLVQRRKIRRLLQEAAPLHCLQELGLARVLGR
jgi:hypothetical protein